MLIDSHFAVRLSDFGLAGFNGATSATQGSVNPGAIRFSAPELFLEDKLRLSFASDIYSFGYFCLEVTYISSSPAYSKSLISFQGLYTSTAFS